MLDGRRGSGAAQFLVRAETLPLTPVLTLVLTLTYALTLSPAPAQLGQSSTLTCHFNRPRASDLGVEWSLRNPAKTLVVYSYYDGASQPQYQDARFMGRATINETLLDLGDASLRLHNVTVQDEGRYRCIVRTRDWKTEIDTQFTVTAPFSVPRVSCHAKPDSVVRLICLATGGYPSSKLSWRWDNGSAYGPGASGSETKSATDGTFRLQSCLDVAVSQAPALRCVLGLPGSNRSESSRATCPAGRSEGSVSMPGRCSNNDGSPAHCSPHRRIGVVLSAVLLLLLVLLALLPGRCCLGERACELCLERGPSA